MTATRRDVLIGGLAAFAASAMSTPAWPARPKNTSYFAGTAVDNGVTYKTTNFDKIDQKWHKQVVKYFSEEPQGTVVVDTRHHFLYLIMENKTAIRYGVGVGREGFKWYGRADHRPQDAVAEMDAAAGNDQAPPGVAGLRRRRLAEEPAQRARHVPASAMAPTLGYRMHGTLEPWSIGTDASSGCIRMFPEYVIDLYQRCPIGTAVQVLPHIADQADKSKPQADPTSSNEGTEMRGQ